MKKMKFKITKDQILLTLFGSIIGALFGYSQAPLIYCIIAPCKQPHLLPYSIFGFLIGGILIYLIEIVYNNFKTP